ncbi:DUF7033 domain-containing protein [Porphyromonas endodontalis]|uniref:DUF7033 domain-containing protein n=1 Tax=Porphyromonas endodontalis TaxID=28124 RepID=UPI002889F02B|nr:hypothetical protein [Porphyromonas endodontalis]
MRTDKIARYIISFLLREEELPGKLTNAVGYTANLAEMSRYKVVIMPSGFFDVGVYGTDAADPKLPLLEWEGIPLLFGTPCVTRAYAGGPILIHADIVASTYYLVSRYEEMYRRTERDAYGRFPGKKSLPYRAGFLHRPIVEEYGEQLRSLLQSAFRESGQEEYSKLEIPPIPRKFARVHLTHDIDCPYEYHGVRSLFRAYVKEHKSLWNAYQLAFRSLLSDRYFTFDRFLEWNREVERRLPKGKCKTLFFYKTPSKEPEDRPNYRVTHGAARRVHLYARKYGVEEAFHIPMEGSLHPERIEHQLHLLEHDLKKSITHARYHYLAAREPEDFLYLLNAGILDDYTMGYPDVAGFRLGTCRPIHYIMPSTGTITNLVLHPLTLMDCSLDRTKYMGLGARDALTYSYQLLIATAKYNGELNLLFHNDLLAKEVHLYHSRLYRELLRIILRIEESDTAEEKPLEELIPCPDVFLY